MQTRRCIQIGSFCHPDVRQAFGQNLLLGERQRLNRGSAERKHFSGHVVDRCGPENKTHKAPLYSEVM